MSPTKNRVVAELGRPETPQETAARKSEASRNHRDRQTVNNLVYALIATVALVVLIVLIVPRGTPIVNAPVNYASIASQAQGSEPDRLVVPVLPKGWSSNSAQLNTGTSDGVDSWYIGLITPDKQYVGITQGFKANSTWLANQLNQSLATGTTTIDGVQWTIYDNRNSGKDNGNVDYALTATSGHSTYVVFGTADDGEITTVARAISPQVRANGRSA
jgi:Protein of unknown function (DUF4245)